MDSKTEMADRDFSLDFVPLEQRRGFWSMFFVMMGFTFFSASMWTGANLGSGLTLSGFAAATLCGNLILGAYCGCLAFMASKTGLSIHLLSRYTFGVKGSYIPSFVLGFTQIGWFGVGIAMFAVPVQAYLEQLHIQCSIWGPVVIAGVLMTSSAYFGIRALMIISVVAVPAVAVFGCISASKVFLDNENAWNILKNFTPENSLTLSTAVALAIGSFISGGTCTPDFVRFAKNPKNAVFTTVLAFFIGNSLMFIFGAVGGMFFKTNDISNVLVAQGMLIPGIIVLGLNIWTTNDNALYTSGLGFANITGYPKKYLVLVNGLIGTVLSVWLYNNFCGYLNFLNTIIPPVGAVLMTDFFLFRKQHYEDLKQVQLPAVQLSAVAAWVCGSAVAFIPWGLQAINGMITAAVVLIVFKKIFPGKSGSGSSSESI